MIKTNEMIIAATCTFGLESVLKKEIIQLGYSIRNTENGRVFFCSDQRAVARANIFLRTAERIHLVLNEFSARDFDELFEGVKAVEWEHIIEERGNIVVKGRSRKSAISSVPVAQAMTKKAVIDRLLEKSGRKKIIEQDIPFPVEIEIEKDKGRLMLDTSGTPLFKRGYRLKTGNAPIKETLAAGLILLSKWNGNQILLDPFCGSGTIPIEAAMMKKRMAPGLNRHFLSMKWKFLDRRIWLETAQEALDIMTTDQKIEIYGVDNDDMVIDGARSNAQEAEVDDIVSLKKADIKDLTLTFREGVIITNPPYGERLGTKYDSDRLYKYLKNAYSRNPGWSLNIITPHPKFQELFGKAQKKRKLYNGNLKCHYYSYF
ncbi:MAG: class I SAM-dependent RNA methyltransferase [Candidatus Delongbacteria bacterium]